MNPFNFKISRQKDLPVLADLLEDQGWREQAEAVRWLVREGKWPYQNEKLGAKTWSRWCTDAYAGLPQTLPTGILETHSQTFHHYMSLNEAIWGFIVAWVERRHEHEGR